MTKQNDHGKWFNYVVSSINCIAFCNSASKAMMTTVYNSTAEEYTYFDAVKRPDTSLKYIQPIEISEYALKQNSGQKQQLRKLLALDDYNQYISGSDNYIQQNSFYLTAQHYH